jgi:5'-nucleotidase
MAPGDDPFGALKARVKQAHFPLLAVNIYEAQTGQRPAWLGNDGTVMLDVGNVKVGVLGLITPSTPQTTNPVNVASLRFGNLVPETLSAAKRLRDRGADVVVAVAHAGSKCPKLEDPKDLSSCDVHSEMYELLSSIPPGTLDAVIAGHTHAPMGHFINGTPVIETWGMGTHFGTIDLYLDPVRKTVLPDRTAIHAVIPICLQVDEATQSCDANRLRKQAGVKLVPSTFLGRPVMRDTALEALLAPALARVAAEQHRKLGVTLPAPLTRNYEAESGLGDVLADSLREMEKADVALLNSGGLRSDLRAGELHYGDVYEVMPFDNTLATLTVTGDELKRLLLAAYGARKGVYQQSGLKVTLSRCPGQERLKAFTLANGKPVVPEARYKVVLPDFLARGGDGLAPVMSSLPPERVDLGLSRPQVLRDALVAFWQQRGGQLVAPRPGRTAFLDDGDGCSEGAKMDLHSSDR